MYLKYRPGILGKQQTSIVALNIHTHAASDKDHQKPSWSNYGRAIYKVCNGASCDLRLAALRHHNLLNNRMLSDRWYLIYFPISRWHLLFFFELNRAVLQIFALRSKSQPLMQRYAEKFAERNENCDETTHGSFLWSHDKAPAHLALSIRL